MVEIAELDAQGNLTLPADIADRFRPSDRFIVWADGDTLHLKRISPPAVTTIVAGAPTGEPMTMDEINDIVHTVRRQRKAR